MIEIFFPQTLILFFLFLSTETVKLARIFAKSKNHFISDEKNPMGNFLESTMGGNLFQENIILLKLIHNPFVGDPKETERLLVLLFENNKQSKELLRTVFYMLPNDYPDECFKIFVLLFLKKEIMSVYEMQVFPQKKAMSCSHFNIMMTEVNFVKNGVGFTDNS